MMEIVYTELYKYLKHNSIIPDTRHAVIEDPGYSQEAYVADFTSVIDVLLTSNKVEYISKLNSALFLITSAVKEGERGNASDKTMEKCICQAVNKHMDFILEPDPDTYTTTYLRQNNKPTYPMVLRGVIDGKVIDDPLSITLTGANAMLVAHIKGYIKITNIHN